MSGLDGIAGRSRITRLTPITGCVQLRFSVALLPVPANGLEPLVDKGGKVADPVAASGRRKTVFRPKLDDEMCEDLGTGEPRVRGVTRRLAAVE